MSFIVCARIARSSSCNRSSSFDSSGKVMPYLPTGELQITLNNTIIYYHLKATHQFLQVVALAAFRRHTSLCCGTVRVRATIIYNKCKIHCLNVVSTTLTIRVALSFFHFCLQASRGHAIAVNLPPQYLVQPTIVDPQPHSPLPHMVPHQVFVFVFRILLL